MAKQDVKLREYWDLFHRVKDQLQADREPVIRLLRQKRELAEEVARGVEEAIQAACRFLRIPQPGVTLPSRYTRQAAAATKEKDPKPSHADLVVAFLQAIMAAGSPEEAQAAYEEARDLMRLAVEFVAKKRGVTQ